MSFNIFEVLHSDWFIYNIQEHLSPKDLFTLKYVCKYYYKNITPKDIKNTIILTIHKRLKQVLNAQYDVFIKYISKNQIVISGSFIIQCILGEYFEDSDIDMYSYFVMTNDILLELFPIESLNEDTKRLFEDYGVIPDISNVINDKLDNGHTLQQIILSQNIKTFEHCKKYILSSFDFDVCKNIFTNIKGKEHLYIYNLWDIINKQITVKTVNFNGKIPRRIEKYTLRGFNFNFDMEVSNYLQYNWYKSPFLVCKYDDDNKFEALTFLGKVFNLDYIKQSLKLNGGKIPLAYCEETDIKNEYMLDSDILGLFSDSEDEDVMPKDVQSKRIAIMKNIFKFVIHGSNPIKELNNCTCPLHKCFKINHEHISCRVNINSKKKKLIDFIKINYNDLNEKFKLEYDKSFNANTFNGKFINCEYEDFYF